MHRFKNINTGEIIETPYAAEAQEYKHSDDFIKHNQKWLDDNMPFAFDDLEIVERKKFVITPEIEAKRKKQLDKEDF